VVRSIVTNRNVIYVSLGAGISYPSAEFIFEIAVWWTLQKMRQHVQVDDG